MASLGPAYWVSLYDAAYPVPELQQAVEQHPDRYELSTEQLELWRAEAQNHESFRRQVLLGAMQNYWMSMQKQLDQPGQPYRIEFIQRFSLIRHLVRIARVCSTLDLLPTEAFEIHPLTQDGTIRHQAARLTFFELVQELGPGHEGRLEARFGQAPDSADRQESWQVHDGLMKKLADNPKSAELGEP